MALVVGLYLFQRDVQYGISVNSHAGVAPYCVPGGYAPTPLGTCPTPGCAPYAPGDWPGAKAEA